MGRRLHRSPLMAAATVPWANDQQTGCEVTPSGQSPMDLLEQLEALQGDYGE